MEAVDESLVFVGRAESAAQVEHGIIIIQGQLSKQGILVKLLYEKRNELIREGRYTDAIDELILKIIDAKGC